MQFRKWRVLAVLVPGILLLLSSGRPAGAAEVRIRATGPAVIDADPQSLVTAAFEVANLSDESLECIPTLDLPPGWRQVSSAPSFRLVAGGRDIRILSIYVPETAGAGGYELTYSVHARKYPAVRDTRRLRVVVRTVKRLTATLLNAAEPVFAGDNYQVVFSVTNKSNAGQTINLVAESSLQLNTVISPDTLVLAPGETARVTASVSTEEDLIRTVRHHLVLKGKYAREDAYRGLSGSFTEIIPRSGGQADGYHRFPAVLSLGVAGQFPGEQKEMAARVEFAGDGTLDESGAHRLAFLARGPDTSYVRDGFGEYDWYFIDYRNPGGTFILGDHFFSLSRLIEPQVYARGGKAEFTTGDTRISL
ncbi:MAG: hypothetical protein MI863_06085, partial [Desulfobacterales bacterium]|nr:hypothetical protein [Desulfobacterales bacterium]